MNTAVFSRCVVCCCALFIALSLSSFAGERKETIKVWGNCNMCKKTIEAALKGVDGVSSASWDKKTKILTVVFDDAKISLEQIEQKVAATGYDTQSLKASDGAYNSLKKCCKYERKKS
ncbi:MAG: heavy-metal-associated domain-containing protein [Bacteroidota bacterium]|nr:heavy-metal-associated domain-containing protein [Bacteroidota bacterium]